MSRSDELLIIDPTAFESTTGDYVVTCGRYLVVGDGGDKLYWSHGELAPHLPQGTKTHALGYFRGDPFFAVDVPPDVVERLGGKPCSLRSLLGQFSDGFFNLLGRGVQLNGWYRDHQFCGRCGGPTTLMDGERAMGCRTCDLTYYPRLAPCIMALVTRGDECLLARNSAWERKNFFSVLAGFIEPGESVEEAVRREVREEVGVQLGRLHYFDSQPWPFPGQLMIGFFADYRSGDIGIDDDEIAEAHWFHYKDLPDIPGDFSLSGQLIRHFVRQCEIRKGS